MIQQQQQIPTFKVMLIGNPKVGKSSVVDYLNRNQMNPNAEYKPSKSINQTMIQSVQQQSVRINIYDTPGNNEYSMLIRNAVLNFKYIILCYNPDNTQSFHDLEQYWIQDVISQVDLKTTNIVLLSISRSSLNQMDSITSLNDSDIRGFINKYNINHYASINLNNKQNIKTVIDYYQSLLQDDKDNGCFTRIRKCFTG